MTAPTTSPARECCYWIPFGCGNSKCECGICALEQNVIEVGDHIVDDRCAVYGLDACPDYEPREEG
jgi:hypothetical protein